MTNKQQNSVSFRFSAHNSPSNRFYICVTYEHRFTVRIGSWNDKTERRKKKHRKILVCMLCENVKCKPLFCWCHAIHLNCTKLTWIREKASKKTNCQSKRILPCQVMHAFVLLEPIKTYYLIEILFNLIETFPFTNAML